MSQWHMLLQAAPPAAQQPIAFPWPGLTAPCCYLQEGVQNKQNDLEALCDQDREMLTALAKDYELDFVSLSFTRAAEDVEDARSFLDSIGLGSTKVSLLALCTCTAAPAGLAAKQAVPASLWGIQVQLQEARSWCAPAQTRCRDALGAGAASWTATAWAAPKRDSWVSPSQGKWSLEASRGTEPGRQPR